MLTIHCARHECPLAHASCTKQVWQSTPSTPALQDALMPKRMQSVCEEQRRSARAGSCRAEAGGTAGRVALCPAPHPHRSSGWNCRPGRAPVRFTVDSCSDGLHGRSGWQVGPLWQSHQMQSEFGPSKESWKSMPLQSGMTHIAAAITIVHACWASAVQMRFTSICT